MINLKDKWLQTYDTHICVYDCRHMIHIYVHMIADIWYTYMWIRHMILDTYMLKLKDIMSDKHMIIYRRIWLSRIWFWYTYMIHIYVYADIWYTYMCTFSLVMSPGKPQVESKNEWGTRTNLPGNAWTIFSLKW